MKKTLLILAAATVLAGCTPRIHADYSPSITTGILSAQVAHGVTRGWKQD